MSDRVAVLSVGRLEQFAPPTEIYDRPGSLFVNTFVGQANRLPGTLLSDAEVRSDLGAVIRVRPTGRTSGQRMMVCIRPEHLRLRDAPFDGSVPGTVGLGLPLGPTVVHEIHFTDGTVAKTVESREAGAAPRAPGTAVHVGVLPDLASAFPTD
jgi:putative spermidine/putrescine transport system ATP-binding protein